MNAMDMQTMLNNMTAARRIERMAGSEQLTLGELTMRLDAVADKAKPVRFDFGGYVPTDLDSWRGSYAELALGYGARDPQTVENLIVECRGATNKTFEGYKGGDFRMSRHTPIWVANWGESGVSSYGGDTDYPTVAVIGVTEADDGVLITTAKQDY
jgi:hypothetical protein